MDDKTAQKDTPPTLPLASILKITLCNPRYLVGITIALIWGAFTNGILYTALPIRYVAHKDQGDRIKIAILTDVVGVMTE